MPNFFFPLTFQPNPQAMQNLLQMGFAEEAVVDALRSSGNKQNIAVS